MEILNQWQCLLAFTLHFSAVLPCSGREEKGAAPCSCVEGTRSVRLHSSVTGKPLGVHFF